MQFSGMKVLFLCLEDVLCCVQEAVFKGEEALFSSGRIFFSIDEASEAAFRSRVTAECVSPIAAT